MAVSLLARLAGGARVPVYVLQGDGGAAMRRIAERMDVLAPVDSPRQASLMLVTGEIPPPMHEAACSIHDQIPEPRAVLHWPVDGTPLFVGAEVVRSPGDLERCAGEVYRELLDGSRNPSVLFGPVDDPVPWQGVGPHGQGGEGMMGGTPYGRAMAMTGEDLRDGLQLDRLSFTVGPFLRWVPTGLRLSVEVQGDVIQTLQVRVPPLRHPDLPDVFRRAQSEPVTLGELELARARHHLSSTADLLRVLGLGLAARRTRELTHELGTRDLGRVTRLRDRLRRSVSLRLATAGIGVLGQDAVPAGGPVARAAARAVDAREDDPAYAELGFRPVTTGGSDARARLLQRMGEAVQALELATRAGERWRAPGAPLEGPRGLSGVERDGGWPERLARMAPGMAWDGFVTALTSLDLDPAAMAPTGDYHDVGPDNGSAQHGEEDG